MTSNPGPVIRPLAYCSERDISRYARGRQFPIIPCNLCGSQDNMKRRDVKAMLAEWERQDPGRTDRLFRSLQNVTASHLADRTLYDFENVGAAHASSNGERVAGEDAGFASRGFSLDD